MDLARIHVGLQSITEVYNASPILASEKMALSFHKWPIVILHDYASCL
jgi:hypothetical protein